MKYIFGFTILLFLLSSCQNNTNQEGTTTETAVETTAAVNRMPAMPKEELIALYNAVDDIDIQFLEKSFSMNAPEAMAKNSITYISDQGIDKSPCTEICYLFAKSQGEQVAHIGAFLNNGCAYYVFYENSKPKYVNAMTQGGVEFFNRILTQVNASGPQ